jgi:ParB family chromosome partitioning protein
MSSDKPLPFQSKSFSLISRAKEEFNRVNPRENDNSTKVEDANLIKGANQAKKRSVLGRGLSQLMSSTTASAVPVQSFSSEGNTARNINPSETNTPDHHKEEMKVIKENDLNFIPIDQLIPNEKQPRKHFSVQEIRELASSIRKTGVLQPIIVRKLSNKLQMGAHYEIVAGERRWRASKEAGLISVPAIIKDLNDRETLEIGIIENIQRQDLNPIEEALAYEALTKDHSCTQDELAKMVGKDRSTISNSLRLLSLPAEVKDLLVQRKLTAGHARALLQLSSPEEQIQRANDIAENKLSVRAVEQGNKEASEKKKSAVSGVSNTDTSPSDERNQALEERLRRALGTKVKVNLSASGKGEVKISFFSRSEFENFLEKVEA